MDIPNTGAIFTLGKSYLAENTQSYFYIKNDPIQKLVTGPFQSAVICESGRLFVWGENHSGQLGISHQSTANNNDTNNNNGNSNISGGDTFANGIITKPTCVKSLKNLGLKIADIAFGQNWSVILTHSNELFFTGQNILPVKKGTTPPPTTTTITNETICYKPFKLEDFDAYITVSEETENYVNIRAGNQHFTVLTSFGRLIGWGSNKSHQLGDATHEIISKPYEMVFSSPVHQCVCGPESTLVLTEDGRLYLTGRLNEFEFMQFTELQKNLSPTEQIIFMYISKANEIFIVTNTGGIYRSYESQRNRSLIFQRYYDFDSEEYGSILKLLKGDSFCAVLTKANKFYTTFSESGHHLKTFREISKFKNLRILDIALGVQHVLVHGIPRSATQIPPLNAAFNHNKYSSVLHPIATNSNTHMNLNHSNHNNKNSISSYNDHESNVKSNETTTIRTHDNLQQQHTNGKMKHTTENRILTAQRNGIELNDDGSKITKKDELINNNNNTIQFDSASPTDSFASRKSTCTVKQLAKHTPNSLSNGLITDKGSQERPTTKTIAKATPFLATATNTVSREDIQGTSPAILKENEENLRRIDDNFNNNSKVPTDEIDLDGEDEDEQLTVEISETTDPLDNSLIVNEIRFINNGVDVTASVKKQRYSITNYDDNEKTVTNDSMAEDINRQKTKISDQITNVVNKTADMMKEDERKVFNVQSPNKTRLIPDYLSEVEQSLDRKTESNQNDDLKKTSSANNEQDQDPKLGDRVKDSLETVALKGASGARGAVETVTDNAQHAKDNISQAAAKVTDNARHIIESTGANLNRATQEAKGVMSHAFRKIAGDTKNVVDTVSSKITSGANNAKSTIASILPQKKNRIDVDDTVKDDETTKHDGDETEVEELENVKEELQEIEEQSLNDIHGKQQSLALSVMNGHHEDDERTTASIKSIHNTPADGIPKQPVAKDISCESDNISAQRIKAITQKSGTDFIEETSNPHNRSNHNKYGNDSEDDEEKLKPIDTGKADPDAVDDIGRKTSKFNRFFKEMRLIPSCRNEKSIQIDDDQPPDYTLDDGQGHNHNHSNSKQRGSKVCMIL